MIIICILTPIISNWRSEGIIFLPIILLLIFLGLRKKVVLKKIILIISVIAISSIVLKYPQKKWENNNMDYSLTAILNPLSNMLQDKNLKNFDELKNDLSPLINLDFLKSNSDYKEIPAYSQKEKLFNEKTNENFSKFKIAYLKLVLYNPKIFFTCRMKTLYATSGFDQYPGWQWETAAFSLKESKSQVIKDFTNSNFLNQDYNGNNRINMIKLMEGKNPNSIVFPLPHQYVFWNLFIVFGALIIWFLLAAYKRNITMLIIVTSLVLYAFAIFCTAPATYFMYYFPVYLITYILFPLYLIDQKKSIKHIQLID